MDPSRDAPREAIIEPIYTLVENPDLIGSLHHYSDMPSRNVAPRNIEVWLPPDYDEGHAKGYAVLYMHDGQNLFEPEKSYIGVDWGMDETIAALEDEKDIPATMVVAIWNTPKRLCEYLPQQPYCNHPSRRLRRKVIKRYGGLPSSDNYLRFIVSELKPFIDCHYHTRPAQASTFIMGSSMGGLISLYALCEYPQVFGGAGSLSTHWPIGQKPFIKYMHARLPEPGEHKIYLDYGSEADHPGYRFSQKQVEHILEGKGYQSGVDWLSAWYAGDPHSETAWRARVQTPLRFLLKNDQHGKEAIDPTKGGIRVY